MARKVKCKKGKIKNQIAEDKKKELQKLWDYFQCQCEEYEAHLNSICKDTCSKIHKLYANKLAALPENIRNMTLSEYLKSQTNKEVHGPAVICGDAIGVLSSEFARSKLLSEKKTQKKNKTERKRSCSVSVCSGMKGMPLNQLPRTSRVMSESCLSTPHSKWSVAPTHIVTPKFNPKVPVSKFCMRRPRAGEILMSLSGSPLLNLADEIPDKPGVAVTLGGGKVIKITEDTEIAKLEKDFVKKLDEDTKLTLENVKKKLDRILQS